MAKNRQRAGDSNKMAILAEMVKNHHAPWWVATLAKMAILAKKKLAKNANLAQTAKTRQRAGNVQNVANIQIGYLKRSHSYFKATFLKTILKLDNKL